MESNQKLILEVSDYKDIKKITKYNPKYINIDIKKADQKIIDYFMKNGSNYLYSDSIDNKKGYIYVDYNIFYHAQLIINNIIFNINSNFNDLEKARYLYIKLGSILGYDINTDSNKNELFNFNNISLINNIWGSIYNKKYTDISIVKLYVYLCSYYGIKCDIICNREGLINRIIIDNEVIEVNLKKDIPYIQALFKTKYFGKYNENIELDKKICYIKNKYNDELIEKSLKIIDYTSDNILYEILDSTQKILNIKSIKTYELSLIYKEIFENYCPNYSIAINNLYYNDKIKSHFLIFYYNDECYCYNYKKDKFIRITLDNINNSIDDEKIGIYSNENILWLNRGIVINK